MRYKEFSQIGVAVVGTGFIGPVHIEALRRLGLNVTGVLGSDPAKSRAARERLGLAKAYASMNELLADKSVDAVHIAVPNIHHHEMAKQALLARKHVLCEKPLAMNSRESLELVRLSQAQGVAAGIAYNVRFYPLNLEARERVQRGDAGVVISVNGAYVQDWLFHDTDYNWRVLADQGGELRAVADIGTHWIDLVTSITGLEVEKLFADLATVHKARLRPRGEVETFTGKLKNEPPALSPGRESVVVTTEDCGNVLFRFRGGARGSLHVSQVTAGRKHSIGY